MLDQSWRIHFQNGWQLAGDLSHMDLTQGCLGALHHGSWLSLGQVIQEGRQKPQCLMTTTWRSHTVISSVSHYLYISSLFSVGGDYTRTLIPGDGDHWGPRHRTPTNSPPRPRNCTLPITCIYPCVLSLPQPPAFLWYLSYHPVFYFNVCIFKKTLF